MPATDPEPVDAERADEEGGRPRRSAEVFRVFGSRNPHAFEGQPSYPAGDVFHKVTGRWELNQARLPAGDQPGKRYDVFVHLPSHGGQANVKYNFIPGDNTVGAKADYCHVNQATRSNGSDTWFEFGTFTFWKGGRIEADNLHDAGTGDADVAFDAMAFVPHNSKVTTQACQLIDSGP
ncbi:hypothetical protein ACGF5O_23450 [Streptomyces sp. NPDC048291]|uniref:hypothetical protein n=1 Tax=Streptomyces sp. NPDC048291 TaxID=3365530 RepID=UPI003717FA8C